MSSAINTGTQRGRKADHEVDAGASPLTPTSPRSSAISYAHSRRGEGSVSRSKQRCGCSQAIPLSPPRPDSSRLNRLRGEAG
jgi:hypothetical protein